MTSTTDLYNLPVAGFLEKLLSERHPELDFAPGSALHDMLVTPSALLLQPLRDYARVALRNLKLRHHAVMNEEELDALASNFLVARRTGERARGVQRVFFARPQSTAISSEARFFDRDGRAFQPLGVTGTSAAAMAGSYDRPSGQYYVDVPCTAADDGVEYEAGAGAVALFQGIPGAVRTLNPQAYSAARDRDSNTQLYARVRGSVVNRDLVKAASIRAAVVDAFPSVRSVRVVGFGDPGMTRDIVTASLAAAPLFRFSFCRKYNLPLDATGAVNHYESDGVTVVRTPIGGRVGAIVDDLDVDFAAIPTSLDGVETTYVPLQPGFRIRLFGSDANDPDIGDYVVSRVLDAPVEPGGPDKRVALLTRALDRESQAEDATELYRYTVVGGVASERFHVGGKVDVLIDSSADVERAVTVAALATDDNGTAEVPLTASASLPSGAPLFEDAVGFADPVLTVLRVEELSFTSDAVLSELTPNVNYLVIRRDRRSRFTLAENDVLVIRGRRADGSSRYAGSRLRVTYVTNPDYAAVQAFLSDDERRDVARDVLVRPPEPVLVDVALRYRGAVVADVVRGAVADLFAAKGFGAEVSAAEIVSAALAAGATDVELPISLTTYADDGGGTVTASSSQDRIACTATQVFRLRSTASVARRG